MNQSFLLLCATAAFLKLVNGFSVEWSRREAISAAASATFGLSSLVAIAGPAFAAGKEGVTKEDIERVKAGYKQITYLLDNFEQETTVCKENGGECKRNADGASSCLR